ncbi:MAG TPA: LysM peptidoglycan-binding domain-containing protein [Chitinophagaceae bacterium]
MQTIGITMRSIALLFSLLFFLPGLNAQTEQLIVKSSNKGPYVNHKVAPKENFYSIGRLFNVHPKHIASFNALDMSKGLSLGQNIKIPLSDTNYSHKTDKGTPIFYVTGNSETVYNVSTNNNVLMEKLRKWNQLTNDRLQGGTKLIVGYLVSNETLAPAVNNAQTTSTTEQIKKTNVDSATKEASKNPTVVKSDVKKTDKKNDASVKPALKPKTEVANKQDEKKDETVKTDKDASHEPGDSNTTAVSDGFFRSSFEQQIKQQPISKEQTVTSGVFKTSSGWSDAKYYLLMNGTQPGTIVRITNPSNNKIIYAKLLGEMTDLKQNQGLNIRISNAAAAALDVSETDKFIVKLNY